jgi:4-cresol dehydrogenase (hydroxylating)
MIRSPFLYAGMGDPQTAAVLADASRSPADAWDLLAKERNLPSWATTLNFYGPPAVIAAQWESAKERYSVIDGIQFKDGPAHRFPLSQAEAEKVRDKAAIGIPSLSIFSMGSRSENYPVPASGHLSFSPVIPMRGDALLQALQVFSAAVSEWGIQPLGFGAGFCMYPRSFVFLFALPLSRDIAANRRTRDFFRHLISLAAAHGWGEYRTHPLFMKEVTDVYSFNENALRRLHETLKDALDPRGILSAGRYAIWPKQLRDRRS